MSDTTFVDGATLTAADWFNDINDFFYTAHAGVAGAGTVTKVQFPATQVASGDANALDDYEEGTWTPALAFGGASVGVTYTSRSGTYTKIGRAVYLQGQFTLSNKGSSNGDATIGGITFTATATDKGGAIGFAQNISFANQMLLLMQSGTSIQLYEVTEAGTPTTLTDADFQNTSRIGFSITFFV